MTDDCFSTIYTIYTGLTHDTQRGPFNEHVLLQQHSAKSIILLQNDDDLSSVLPAHFNGCSRAVIRFHKDQLTCIMVLLHDDIIRMAWDLRRLG